VLGPALRRRGSGPLSTSPAAISGSRPAQASTSPRSGAGRPSGLDCERAPDRTVPVSSRLANVHHPPARLPRRAGEGYVQGPLAHYGATSQGGLAPGMASGLKPCPEEAHGAPGPTGRALVRRAREHRATPTLGRTLMQPALPITAGLRIARWAMALAQDRERLAEAQSVGLAVQLGGAVGALEALGDRGAAVRHRLALALGLLSRGNKLFEVVYMVLWYAGPVNRVAALDFRGATTP